VEKALNDKGIQPAFDPKMVFAHIYRREDTKRLAKPVA
jgi:hypothetical protein